MFKIMYCLLLVMGIGCQPAMATNYVTQDQFFDGLHTVHQDLSAQLSNGIGFLNDEILRSSSKYALHLQDKLDDGLRDAQADTALALALASAPDPLPASGDLGYSLGFGYLQDSSAALAVKVGERNWHLGAAINRRSFALSAGCRL